MTPPKTRQSQRRLWRLLAAAAAPVMVGLWALWRDVLLLEASGLTRVGGPRQFAEWALLSIATAGLAATFWSASRSLRVVGYTFYALVLSVSFGVAGVLGVMHAFGGPQGNLSAPAWGLLALSLAAASCVGSLLATAALLVADVRTAEEDER